MLRGEEGRQARELDELIGWLRLEKPEVICLSNALLIGLTRRLRSELRVPVICTLQGEDWFLDSLPPGAREQAWQTVAERAAEADLFIAPSRYFADLMRRRLQLPQERVRVVFNGINLEGFSANRNPHPQSPTSQSAIARPRLLRPHEPRKRAGKIGRRLPPSEEARSRQEFETARWRQLRAGGPGGGG